MAEIQLTNILSGVTKAFPLAVFDWEAFTAAGHSASFSDNLANVSDVSDAHKTFYYLDQFNTDLTAFLSGVIDPNTAENVIYLGEAETYQGNFLQESSGTYLPDYTGDTVVWFWKQPGTNSEALEAGGTFVPNRLYFKSETACALYQTTNGGTIGGSVGVYYNGANTAAVLNIGANQLDYGGGLYQYNARHDYCAKWNGLQIVDFSAHPTRNYSNAAEGYNVCTTGQPVPKIDRFVSQCVYTVISGYPYIGMAAIQLDALGVPVSMSTVFLPAWFWGDFSQPEDPEDAPKYYGIDDGISGGDGTYTDTSTAPSIPSAIQPFSSVSADSYGLHVYAIIPAQYDALQEALWGGGTIGKNLWNKWLNYKFNPIASIISCHYLPASLKPVITPTNLQQLRAGGCAIISSGVEYLNSKTTVDKSFGPSSVDKFFSNHLNYTPFSHFQLFLPFCGWMDIPADRLRGGSIKVTYRCDVITGNVCAFVDCTDQDGHTVQYTKTGNAALSVPVTGRDDGTGTAVGAISGLALGLLTGSAGLAAGVAGAALSISGAQHTTQQASQYGGSIAAMGPLQIILVCTQPIKQDTERARDLRGLVSYVDATISQLAGTGYTECAEVRADIAGATDEEKQEIERILKGGVYL